MASPERRKKTLCQYLWKPPTSNSLGFNSGPLILYSHLLIIISRLMMGFNMFKPIFHTTKSTSWRRLQPRNCTAYSAVDGRGSGFTTRTCQGGRCTTACGWPRGNFPAKSCEIPDESWTMPALVRCWSLKQNSESGNKDNKVVQLVQHKTHGISWTSPCRSLRAHVPHTIRCPISSASLKRASASQKSLVKSMGISLTNE